MGFIAVWALIAFLTTTVSAQDRDAIIAKAKEGYWVSAYHNASVVSYNTNLVKPQELPKSYDDLLDPKWKGKMLMDSRETEWYASMLQILGREKGLRLMRGLAKQDLSFRP